MRIVKNLLRMAIVAGTFVPVAAGQTTEKVLYLPTLTAVNSLLHVRT